MSALLLIVDDDSRSAMLLATMLRGEGYETEVATDGAAALARLAREPVPDVLITDFFLPHADGLAVLRYARSRRASMRIFMITGHPQAFMNASTPVDHPVTLITKPLEYDDLVRRLAAA